MEKKDFDNYKFSINTQIKYFEDYWDKVVEVNFADRTVGIERGQIVEHTEIEKIRN